MRSPRSRRTVRMSMIAEATLTILSAIAASRRRDDGLRMVADDDNQAPLFPR